MSKNLSHTLYLCYFGLREPLVQTQVLPYLRELKKNDNLKISLLTFEPNFKQKWSAEQIADQKKTLAAENINWDCLPYHKRPSAPATVYDILRGAFFAWKMIRRENVDMLHARVHVPAVMGLLAKKFSRKKPKLLFDIRGFFPEEYTDAGIWKANGWLYKSVKKIEKQLFKDSDAFVVLTEKARQILFPESKETGFDRFGRPVEVIPCCVDLAKFETIDKSSRGSIRQKLNVENRRVIIYVGSLGSWYKTDEMMEFFAAARKHDPKNFALVLTQRDAEKSAEQFRAKGFADEDFFVGSVSHKEIPQFLEASDVAISFIKACYSKLSSSPTKIAEYLACGVPVICNRGVGDVDELIQTERVGTLIDDFTPESYLKALTEIDVLSVEGGLSERCRETARRRFDLETIGGAKYRHLYQQIEQISDGEL